MTIIECVLIYVGRELRTWATALSPTYKSQIYMVGWIISAFPVTLKPCHCHGYISILLASFSITSLLHDEPCNTSKPITASRARFSPCVRNTQRLSLHSAVTSFFFSLSLCPSASTFPYKTAASTKHFIKTLSRWKSTPLPSAQPPPLPHNLDFISGRKRLFDIPHHK